MRTSSSSNKLRSNISETFSISKQSLVLVASSIVSIFIYYSVLVQASCYYYCGDFSVCPED